MQDEAAGFEDVKTQEVPMEDALRAAEAQARVAANILDDDDGPMPPPSKA